ncbi:cyanophycin synthetase [Halanaerobiaceae bacterium Z-7014]|uniref:Cyanophycin synthetase n=1 Tax=Halonatronomonas betaini TaxID=2778430 RepID=A0A931ASF1_9FIRM|nr:cyanophycin synthetase [Halonatronomonas betaini]MBF8437284.1 cyanophycin synthetase [Halonatronomonas betaini]
MRILEIRALRGPNLYSLWPVIFIKLDIGSLEEKPTDLVPGFRSKLEDMMPSLYEHSCSPGRPGGFFERIERGTWAAHVVEHVAIELQGLADNDVSFGKTFSTEEKTVYNVVYSYVDENVGLQAGQFAINIVDKLFQGETSKIEPLVYQLKKIRDDSLLGPSTEAIVDEARRRGIPHIRLNEYSYVQLGHGRYQRRIQATMMDSTSALGVEIADNKEYTKQMLAEKGIPVPEGISVSDFAEAKTAANQLGYPVVVKPLVGNHGRGISIDIQGEEELAAAYQMAKKVCEDVLIEKLLVGTDFRILVINGRFVAAAKREPAFVIGDGNSTVQQLIEEVNNDPKRGVGHEKNLTKIIIDTMTKRLLVINDLSLETILPAGEKLYIKSTANLSSGGTAVNVTENVHPLVKLMAERITRIIGLDVIGIDIVAPTLQEPLQKNIGGVVEVNAAPGFRMHLDPTKGQPINVAVPVVDMLFPPGAYQPVPIVAVTGTNGKTTTVRLIAHILGLSGNVVGMTSTDAVVIDNIPVLEGDFSGPAGAKAVLTDATIDHAVLEVARGGILRRGLGYSRADVGVLLNISSDHLGEGEINTLEDLARLKSTVIEAVKSEGHAVINADDQLVLDCLENTRANPILFSINPENPALKENLDKGNMNVILQNGNIVIKKEGWESVVASAAEIPITFTGKAIFNIKNVLSAVAAVSALGLNAKQIRAGLVSFSASLGQSPGRMNIIEIEDYKVVIDYGHNIGAIKATGDFINSLGSNRIIRMASGTGNRREEDIIEFGYTLAQYYDHIIISDPDPRSRKLGETAELVRQGLLDGGFKDERIDIIFNEQEATQVALGMAKADDVIVLQADNIDQVISDVLAAKNKFEEETQSN